MEDTIMRGDWDAAEWVRRRAMEDAIRVGDLGAVKKLLAGGADPSGLCNNGFGTYVYYATGMRRPEILRALLDAGGCARGSIQYLAYLSCLTRLAECAECLELLLARGDDPANPFKGTDVEQFLIHHQPYLAPIFARWRPGNGRHTKPCRG